MCWCCPMCRATRCCRPYAAGNLQGVTPSFGTWATTDHMMGIALGFRDRALARGAVRRLPRACRRLCFLRGDVALLRHERHDLFFRGLAHSAWPRRRRHNPGRAIRAARRISGESENVRRRALGRAQHDAIHGRHLSGRLVFGISRLALFCSTPTFRSRCWPPASWARCFTAAGVGGASRVSTSLAFSCSAAIFLGCRRFSTWATTSTGSTRRSCSAR